MTLKKLTTEPWPRIIGIPLVGILLTFAFKNPPFTYLDFLISIAITGIIWQGDCMIIFYFRKVWPSLDQTPRRILTTIGVILIYNTAMDLLACGVLVRTGLVHDYWSEATGVALIKNFGATFVIGSLYESGYFFERWKKQTIETEQVRSERLRAELSALKNQISPHFLFNSLNTLLALIHENPAQAARFTEKLSEVYRYILQYKDREVVKLSTEIRFTEAFIFLLQMRFEQGLDVQIDISPELMEKYVAPLTLQLLVENAVKHNVVSTGRPLRIDIYAENGRSLIVRNKLQRKAPEGTSTRTGLDNIRRRYGLLSDIPIDIIETRDHFMVALPLLNLTDQRELSLANL